MFQWNILGSGRTVKSLFPQKINVTELLKGKVKQSFKNSIFEFRKTAKNDYHRTNRTMMSYWSYVGFQGHQWPIF